MEYYIIGLLGIIIVLLLILLFRPRNNEKDHEETKAYLNSCMHEAMVSLLEQNSKQSEQSRTKLEQFERAINQNFNQRFDALAIRLDNKLSLMNEKVEKNLSSGFHKTDDTYRSLIERLARIDEAQNNITSLSKDVISLKNTLENNQNRGKFGEYALERILFSIFGDAKKGVYEFQYTLYSQDKIERPDAVVFLPYPNMLICIDSKFPYQDYKRLLDSRDEAFRKSFIQSVKKHIADISSKYIIAGKTAKEALMFVPSDAVFGYICGEVYELVEFARQKSVILTSPSTLQPILATINMVRIDAIRNENLNVITNELKGLGNDFTKFGEDWIKLSKQINVLITSKDSFDKKVQKIHKRFTRLDSEHILDLEEAESEEYITAE